MNVCWSSTTSASCSRVSVTCAATSARAPDSIVIAVDRRASSVHSAPSISTASGRGLDERERGHDRVGVPFEPGGQLLAEEPRRVDVDPVAVHPAANVDRHA